MKRNKRNGDVMPLSDEPATGTVRDKTIRDFGDQWNRFKAVDNEGFYGSVEHLQDTFGPLLDVNRLAGANVAEIGSGPGRFVNMLLDAGVEHVTALEPSSGLDVLKINTKLRANRITYVHAAGEELPLGRFDLVFSVGVLMLIPDPHPVVDRAFQALKPGGEMLIWLYSREGNELYLTFVEPLRWLTTKLPDAFVVALSHVLNIFLSLYMYPCRWLPLPRYRHIRHVIAKMTWRQRTLVIFDQLNPAHAKYYRRVEAEGLLRDSGFVNVQIYHRHGYSWAMKGSKPS